MQVRSSEAARSARPPHPPTPHPPPVAEPASADTREPSAFAKVLGRLGGEIDRGERVVDQASQGGPAGADPGTLIALQAGVYRYVEAVDLASKLVDRATNGVKTVLQSQ